MEYTFSSQKLIALRKLKGYSQERLSDEAGINIRTLQRLEKNEGTPQPHTLNCLAKVLEISIEEFCDFSTKVTNLEESNQQLSFLHFSPIAGCIIPFGNIIFPYIISYYQKNKSTTWDKHFRAVLNFHLSCLLFTIITLILYFTIDFLAFTVFLIPIIAFTSLILFPLLSGISVIKNKRYFYPLSLKII